MAIFYQPEKDQLCFIFPDETKLLFLQKKSDFYYRPTILCNQYRSDLSGIPHEASFYYSYLSTDQTLHVRKIGEAEPFYHPSELPDTAHILFPTLTSLDSTLLLLYLITDSSGTLLLHLDFPLNPDKNIFMPLDFSTCQAFRILPCQEYLLLYFQGMDSSTLYTLDTALTLREIFFGTSPQIQSKIDVLTSDIENKDKQILELNHTISSITTQYTELMNVAQKYKVEAEKWYSTFLHH